MTCKHCYDSGCVHCGCTCCEVCGLYFVPAARGRIPKFCGDKCRSKFHSANAKRARDNYRGRRHTAGGGSRLRNDVGLDVRTTKTGRKKAYISPDAVIDDKLLIAGHAQKSYDGC